MKIVNLTPHDIVLMNEYDRVQVTLPSAGVARAKVDIIPVGTLVLDGEFIPLVESHYGEPVDLPEPAEDVAYIVSLVTAQAAREHGRTTDDLLLVQKLVRDGDGQVIGARALSRL